MKCEVGKLYIASIETVLRKYPDPNSVFLCLRHYKITSGGFDIFEFLNLKTLGLDIHTMNQSLQN